MEVLWRSTSLHHHHKELLLAAYILCELEVVMCALSYHRAVLIVKHWIHSYELGCFYLQI